MSKSIPELSALMPAYNEQEVLPVAMEEAAARRAVAAPVAEAAVRSARVAPWPGGAATRRQSHS